MDKKILIIYYSRTGMTRKIAETLAVNINADIEEIIDLTDRSGPIGYILAGKDAANKNLTRIRKIEYKPSDYDLVIIGTPIWAWTIAPAIRSYIEQNKPFLKDKQFAFFCTQGGAGDKNAFKVMEELVEKKPIATLMLLTSEVRKDAYNDKLMEFIHELKESYLDHVLTRPSVSLKDDTPAEIEPDSEHDDTDSLIAGHNHR